jgi:heme exporter protein CcmD
MSAADQLVFVAWAYAAAAAIAVGLIAWTWADGRALRQKLDRLDGESGTRRDR